MLGIAEGGDIGVLGEQRGAGDGQGGVERGEGSGQERVMGQAVDAPRQPAGGLEDRLDSGGLEERQLGARSPEPVRDVLRRLVARQRRQVIADDDALAQRLVHRHREAPSKLGLPAEVETIVGKRGVSIALSAIVFRNLLAYQTTSPFKVRRDAHARPRSRAVET